MLPGACCAPACFVYIFFIDVAVFLIIYHLNILFDSFKQKQWSQKHNNRSWWTRTLGPIVHAFVCVVFVLSVSSGDTNVSFYQLDNLFNSVKIEIIKSKRKLVGFTKLLCWRFCPPSNHLIDFTQRLCSIHIQSL